jgi:hypothetical protein
MCKSQAEGGQRCSAHTRPAFESARQAVTDAIASGETHLAADLWTKYDKAAAEHASTTAGQAEIVALGDAAANRGDHTEAAFMYNAEARGAALRAQNVDAGIRIAGLAAFRSEDTYTFTSSSQLGTVLNPDLNPRVDEKPVEFTLNDGTSVYGTLSTASDDLDLVGRDGNVILRNIYDHRSGDLAERRITGMTLNPPRPDTDYAEMFEDANMYGSLPDLNEHQLRAAVATSGYDPDANAMVLASPRASAVQKRRAMEFANNFDHSNTEQLTRWNAVVGLANIVHNKDGHYTKDDRVNAYLLASDILTSSKRHHPEGFGHFQNVFSGGYDNVDSPTFDTSHPDNAMINKMYDQIFNDGTGY